MRRTPLAVLLVPALLAPTVPAANADQTFRVIVHPAVEGTQIPRGTLSSIFLGGVGRWGTGLPVRPVDQSMRSAVRAAFTEQVLSTPVEGLPSYWHAMIKKGVTPPPVKPTDSDVIAYVARTEGAIGYVSLDTPVPASVKTLSVID